MKEFCYTITDPQGVHARPATLFVKEAAKYPCSITLEKEGKTVDAKRMFAVMSLGIKQGQKIVLRCDGEQEDGAAEALSVFMKENM